MPLNDDEKVALSQFVASDLYKRAKEEVLNANSVNSPPATLIAAGILAAEIAVSLASEKGMSIAFRELERLSRPTIQIPPQPTHKPLKTTK